MSYFDQIVRPHLGCAAEIEVVHDDDVERVRVFRQRADEVHVRPTPRLKLLLGDVVVFQDRHVARALGGDDAHRQPLLLDLA
jgi:hypothetical protein